MSARPAIEGWFTTGAGAGAARVAVHDVRDRLLPAGDRAGFCRNPACDGEEFETVELSRRGTVWSYTDAQYQPPPPYVPRTDPYEPFALAAVELRRGDHRCWARSPTATASRTCKVGAEVELVVEPLTPTTRLTCDLALEARHRAGRGGGPVSTRRRRPRRGHAPVGQVGPAVHRVRRRTPPGPRSPTPASTGPTSTSSSAARPSATATAATSPARPSPRRSAGTAPASPRRTPPARPAPRRSTPPGPGSSPACPRSRWSSAPTPRPRASSRPTPASGGTTRTGCGSGCSA